MEVRMEEEEGSDIDQLEHEAVGEMQGCTNDEG